MRVREKDNSKKWEEELAWKGRQERMMTERRERRRLQKENNIRKPR